MTTSIYQPQRGTMPVLQFCMVDQLLVDPLYQREIDTRQSHTLINRIARGWDWRLYQPLVVARRTDGSLYVVDGQHRHAAARIRGDIVQLPCVVTDYGDPRAEASAFVELNQQRKPLSKLNLFKAALASQDADALAIDAIVTRAGMRITGAADVDRWKPGWINNVTALQTCFRQHGERGLRISLEILRDAFPDTVLRNCGTMFSAIVPVVAAQGTRLSAALLIDILRDADQATWMGRFRAAATARDIGVPLASKQLVAEAYDEAMAE